MIEAFKNELDKAGLSTKEKIVGDGRLHRFHVEGDNPGSKNGWYVLYGDSIPAGSFGSWKTGDHGTWSQKAARDLTSAEREEYRRRMDAARKVREAEEQARRAAAREKALTIWKASPPAPDNHSYLVEKAVRSHGLRLYRDLLVIPMRDNAGTLHSLQFIDGEGNKRFLSGGRKKGCYFLMGSPAESLCIAEGYATAAAVYEPHLFKNLPMAVAVAFDAGNLEAVARALRARFPEMEITLCADNDTRTPGNPGLTKAREAAAAVGALLSVPPCHGDFNDLYRGISS